MIWKTRLYGKMVNLPCVHLPLTLRNSAICFSAVEESCLLSVSRRGATRGQHRLLVTQAFAIISRG